MKMGNDPMAINNVEFNSVQKQDNPGDVDQPKGDLKIFVEDFNVNDSKCHNKYVDSLPVEKNNSFVILEPLGRDCCADVEDTQVDAGFDHLAEPSAMCPSKTRADDDNNVQTLANPSVSELELSVSQECCRETDGSAIKDICIDEGVPVKGKVLIEDIVDEGLKHVVEDTYSMKTEEFDSKTEKLDAEWSVPVGLMSSTDEACEKDFNSCESKVLIHQNLSKSESTGFVLSDFPTADTLSEKNTDADESQLISSMKNGCNDEQEIEHKASATDQVAIGKLICSSSTPENSADDNKMETSDIKTEPATEAANKSSLPTTVKNNEVELALSANHPQLPYTFQMLQQQKLALDHFTASAPLQRDHFESSFASVGHHTGSITYSGPHTGSITYSGPIAHSGSLSHRSDASSASTRSFAFPVLQNEWNFSPVRMQKADRRHLRRHRGWMNGLFCCKF